MSVGRGMLFVATCDLSAHVQGRAVPADDFDRVRAAGTGWVPANLALAADGHLIDGDVFGFTGDLRLRPDPSTRCTVGGHKGGSTTEIMLADQTELDGSPWSCCPRNFVRSAVAALADAGLRAQASFEHEFMLRDTNVFQPFSLQRLLAIEPFGSDLIARAREAGLEPETWLPEYGAGQFEVTLRPTDPVAAADRAIIVRELARDVGRETGHDVTFSPMVYPEDVGNGVHVHFSLFHRDGTSALHDSSRPGALSALGASFAAGVIRHAAAICALTAGSPLSYTRLTPGLWSAAHAYVGLRDREAMLRISPTTGDPGEAATQYNLEFRAADATANPWLVMGAILRAGIQGLRADYAPTPVSTQTDSSARELAAALPRTLDEALEALEQDTVVRDWFDPRLLETYVAIKRVDIKRMSGVSLTDQCAEMSRVY